MNLEQVNELMKVIYEMNEKMNKYEKLIPAINKIHLETFHPVLEREPIDVTPICKAIADMTDSLKFVGNTAVMDIIRHQIEDMVKILDKCVNGEIE